MRTPVCLHFSGVPGSGKSTIAAALGPQIEAIVIDNHVIQSALQKSKLEKPQAELATYRVLYAMAESMLRQKRNVIIEYPCHYGIQIAVTRGICDKARAKFRFAECVLDDLNELDRRLRARRRMPSQIGGIQLAESDPGESLVPAALMRFWQSNLARPGESVIVLDTSRPVAENVQKVAEFLTE